MSLFRIGPDGQIEGAFDLGDAFNRVNEAGLYGVNASSVTEQAAALARTYGEAARQAAQAITTTSHTAATDAVSVAAQQYAEEMQRAACLSATAKAAEEYGGPAYTAQKLIESWKAEQAALLSAPDLLVTKAAGDYVAQNFIDARQRAERAITEKLNYPWSNVDSSVIRQTSLLASMHGGPRLVSDTELLRIGGISVAEYHARHGGLLGDISSEDVRNMQSVARLVAEASLPSAVEPYRLGLTSVEENLSRLAIFTGVGSVAAMHPSAVEAFSKLSALGAVFKEPSFNQIVAEDAYAAVLGDWRGAVMPHEALSSASDRLRFYDSLGFDAAITAWPRSTYSQLLDSAGLWVPRRRSYRDRMSARTQPREVSIANRLVYRFEPALREFIHEMMSLAYGPDWLRERAPSLHKRFLKKALQNKLLPDEKDAGALVLLQEASFEHYRDIILQDAHWEDVFCSVFVCRETFLGKLEVVRALRNVQAHNKTIRGYSKADLAQLRGAVRWLVARMDRAPRW